MAWKRRGNRSYYYTAHVSGGRIREVYHGSGARGKMAERIVQGARSQRKSAVVAVREYWSRFETGTELIRQLDENCHWLTDARLLSEGCWRSTSYRWGKRRRPLNRRKLKISRNAAQPSDLVPLIQLRQYGDDDACSDLAAELNTNLAPGRGQPSWPLAAGI